MVSREIQLHAQATLYYRRLEPGELPSTENLSFVPPVARLLPAADSPLMHTAIIPLVDNMVSLFQGPRLDMTSEEYDSLIEEKIILICDNIVDNFPLCTRASQAGPETDYTFPADTSVETKSSKFLKLVEYVGEIARDVVGGVSAHAIKKTFSLQPPGWLLP